MKAMTLSRPKPAAEHPLEPVSIPDPEPAPDEVVIEVSACGVCRTDLHIVEGDLTPPSYPVVPGHQAVGKVVSRGSEVGDLSPGDRVGVAWVGRFCGTCEYCRDGRENLCEKPIFTGFHRQGGFAARVSVAAAFVHPVPDSLGEDTQVAPLLCAGIIGYRALKQSRLKPGRPIALYGFGAAAHIAIQVATGWNCEVYVVTRGTDSVKRAKRMGAVWAGLPGERLPRKVDHAVSFAPVGSVIPDAMSDLRPGGVLSIAGIYVDRIPELDYEKHLFMERSVVSTTANTRDDARELLALAGDLGIGTDVELFRLEEANEALHRLAEGRLRAQAAVLEIKGR
jgi:propanol-preferring alcohol dehydrogenase